MSDTDIPTIPDQTIPAASGDGTVVADFRELRKTFGIFPCEDGSEYHNLKLLGMGGMGVVFSGDDPTLQRQVAVKLLREPFRCNRELIGKFVNEARITARIDHPNIVAVHQLGVNEHHGVYFSMRRISGENLQTVIRKLHDGDPEARKNYSLRRLLDIFIAGCNGVAAAHEKQILHCDLKPANIMIGAFGEVLVLDWGLAREIGGDPQDEKKHVISGTPAFMAPELVTGQRSSQDILTDVYALGMILYSILTWRTSAFDMTQNKDVLMEKVASGRYLPLRPPKGYHLPRELAAICRKAMAIDRSERYSSVTELLQDLYNFRDGRAVKAYSPNVIYRFFKLCRRHPAIPIAVMVALMTLLVHRMAVGVFEYAHDRSLMRSAEINLRIADDSYRRAMVHHWADDNMLIADLLKAAIREKNFLLQANLALMEYFSILDSMGGLSASGTVRFSRESAPGIYRNILKLAIATRDSEKVEEVLARCRRLDFFDEACRTDRELAALVRRINERTAFLTLDSENFSGTGILRYPDGTEEKTGFSGSRSFDLPAGEYQLLLDNGISLRLYLTPGSHEKIFLPPVPEGDDRQLIPADHYRLPVPGTAPVRCDLAAFYLTVKQNAVPVEFAQAEKMAAEHPGNWRLPYPVELRKAWSRDAAGGAFYRSEPAGQMVWLNNGMLYDPVSRTVNRAAPGQTGEVYLVKSVGRK